MLPFLPDIAAITGTAIHCFVRLIEWEHCGATNCSGQLNGGEREANTTSEVIKI